MSAAQDFKDRPWSIQPGEPPHQFAAFITYLELGRDRSIVKALDKSGEHPGKIRQWERWSRANQWVSRAQAYDSDHLMERIAGRKEAQEEARQDAVDAARRAMGHVIEIMDGKLPPGDKEIVCGRDGKPQKVTIEGAFGVPVEVAMTRALVSPQVRLKAAELALGLGGLVTAKRIEVSGHDGDDIRLALRNHISNLPPEIKQGLMELLAIGNEVAGDE